MVSIVIIISLSRSHYICNFQISETDLDNVYWDNVQRG